MNYNPNETDWQVGDLVIHDADAKTSQMLMIVTGKRKDGQIETRYFYPSPSRSASKVWVNDLACLHDPARFGIELPNTALYQSVVEILGQAANFREITSLIANYELLLIRQGQP